MPTVNALNLPVVAAIRIETDRRHYVEFGLCGRAVYLHRNVVPVEFAIDLVIDKYIADLAGSTVQIVG